MIESMPICEAFVRLESRNESSCKQPCNSRIVSSSSGPVCTVAASQSFRRRSSRRRPHSIPQVFYYVSTQAIGETPHLVGCPTKRKAQSKRRSEFDAHCH